MEIRQQEPAELSDERLLQALAMGALWAMEPLYDRYSKLLYSLAYHMVGQHQHCEELVQEAFLAVWQRASSYSPHLGSVRTWLISLLRHRAIDDLRRVERRSRFQEVPWEMVQLEEEVASSDMWEEVWGSMRQTLVRVALGHLPSEQRLVITLAYFEGWTHTQIAQRCNLPLGTVKARIRLGLGNLQQVLEHQGGIELSDLGRVRTASTKPRHAVAAVVVQATHSGCATGYELCRDGTRRCFGYTEWEPLVEQVEMFEFRGHAGSFLARKDKQLNGSACWYALSRGSTRRKVPLGRAAELTLPRLEAVADQFRTRERNS